MAPTRAWLDRTFRGAVTLLLALLLVPSAGLRVSSAAGPTVVTGRLDGATYQIAMPRRWSGLLFLWSHGDQGSGPPHVSTPGDAAQTPSWLLAHGIALATSSYSHGGWSVAAAMQDQLSLLTLFTRRYGRPRATIAWGQSSGALVSAGLVERYPERFAGALPECGIFDPVGIWNAALNVAFVLRVLVAPHAPLQLVHLTDPQANLAAAQQILAQAQRTPQGHARLVFAAALLDLPDGADLLQPGRPHPALAPQAATLIAGLQHTALPLTFAARAELEHSAGGNPSWNTGVDYGALLAGSVDRDIVRRLYAQAGLSLSADLRTLARAPRLAADPVAVAYLARNITLTGRLQVPILTLHTTDDDVAPVEQEQVYAARVRAAGRGALLRQLYVLRAGHGTVTAAEEITAIQALLQRLRSGHWGALASAALNQQAQTLGPTLNVGDDGRPAAPRFSAYRLPAYARPSGTRGSGATSRGPCGPACGRGSGHTTAPRPPVRAAQGRHRSVRGRGASRCYRAGTQNRPPARPARPSTNGSPAPVDAPARLGRPIDPGAAEGVLPPADPSLRRTARRAHDPSIRMVMHALVGTTEVVCAPSALR